MRSADPRRGGRAGAGFVILLTLWLAVPGSGSPARVTALGGDSQLLLDGTNLFDHPALLRELAHVDVEIFDDWAGGAVPIGERHAVAFYLNRPTRSTADLTRYLAGTGSRLLRSLKPQPWVDAIGGSRMGGVDLGIGLRYAYDVRDLGAPEASVSQWDGRLGIAAGPQGRRLEATLRLERVRLRDRGDVTPRSQSGGTGLGLDLRGRWAAGADGVLLPSMSWWHSDAGLAPEERRLDRLRAALAYNVRPVPTALVVVGIVAAMEREHLDIPADGLSARNSARYLLPAVVAGGEVQAGSLLFRIGLRHESVVDDRETPASVDLAFGTSFTANVGLGIEVGDLLIDGIVEKDFLRDGPHFLGGSAHGGGLLSTVSLAYRFYH